MLKLFKKIFKKEVDNPNPRVVHIWKCNGWGNNVYWIDFSVRELTGHLSPKPVVGDLFYDKMTNGKVASFKVVRVEGTSVRDQFFATLVDNGYVDEW